MLSEIKAELEPSCVLFWVSGLDIIGVGSSRSWLILSTFFSFQAITLHLLNVSVVSSKSSRWKMSDQIKVILWDSIFKMSSHDYIGCIGLNSDLI